ncbi:MAG: hypothetical protein QOE65_2469 [Solirubrobacteraceae bacterium]|nr:hypothetical protein [Solirubrobacteraceae bacterium]
MLWRVLRERAVRLSAPRALLLQAAHPLVWAGLMGYGRGLDPAHDRLNRTATALGLAAFGSPQDADRVGRRVRDIHARAHGRLRHDAGRFPRGTPYAADDPELLLWVLAPIADSALAVHDLLVRPLSRDERDGVWQGYRQLGEVFGLAPDATPATIEELDAYMAEMVAGPDLHVGRDVRAHLPAAVLRPRVAASRRPLVGLLGVVTAGLLPPRLRRDYGVSWGPARRRALRTAARGTRAVATRLPDRLRHAPIREVPADLTRGRPVLAGDLRRDGGAVVIVAGAREVRVDGEPELAARVLALCDGRRSVRQILDELGDPSARDDVHELLALLSEYGALRVEPAR